MLWCSYENVERFRTQRWAATKLLLAFVFSQLRLWVMSYAKLSGCSPRRSAETCLECGNIAKISIWMTTHTAILNRHYICIKDSIQIILEFKWIQCIHILTIKNRRKQSAAGSVVIISGLIWCVCSVYQWITQKNRRKYTAEEIAEKFVLQLMSCRNWMENVTNWNVTDGCFSCFFRTLSVWALSNNSNVIYFNLSAPWEHFPHVTTRSLRLHLLFRHCTKYHAKLICGHTHTHTHTLAHAQTYLLGLTELDYDYW